MSLTPGSALAPRLSIVIPTLNRARLVERALQSALAQTSAEIEIIVSDNGSSDGTTERLQRYADPRLRKYRHDKTMPAEEHGNFLVAQARGEYLLGLSDDDHLEPAFVESVLALFDKHPDLAFVYTGCVVHYAETEVPTLCGPEVESGAQTLRAFLAGQREICWCACVTRLADLRQIGPIPSGRIFGDMYYWMRLAREGLVGCVAQPLAHYTFMSSDNLSTGVPVPRWADETRLLVEETVRALDGEGIDLTLAADGHRFVARSTANQFVWNAIRGAARVRLLREGWVSRSSLAGDWRVWPRAVAALLLPRRWTHALVLRLAARRRVQRRGG